MVPPEATIDALYADPDVAPGSEVEVMVNVLGGGLVVPPEMARLNAAVAVCEEESFTVIPTENVPPAVGSPMIADH